jgi:hypothetical protein
MQRIPMNESNLTPRAAQSSIQYGKESILIASPWVRDKSSRAWCTGQVHTYTASMHVLE